MHDYRAIFLDIDGTLTQPGHSAPPVSAVAAIGIRPPLGAPCFPLHRPLRSDAQAASSLR